MDENTARYLLGLLSVLPKLVVLAACIFFIAKETTTEGVLLFLGALFGIFSSILYSIVPPYLRQINVITNA